MRHDDGPPARLHRALVRAEGRAPLRWMLVLHGILGSGGNLRTLARRLADAAPAWGFALVDLRMHGLSQGAAPPHTVAAAAADLASVVAELPGPVAGVLGHSFGGKVALAFGGARADAGAPPLDELWVLDASPGLRSPDAARDPKSSEAVLALLEALPQPVASREAFLDFVRSRGHTAAVAEWLAMNLVRDGEAFRLRLDLPAVRALLEDYQRTDLWPVVERGAAARRGVDFVIGGRSPVVDAAARARLAALAARGLARVHVLPEAGHWVHVDAADALVHLVGAALRQGGDGS